MRKQIYRFYKTGRFQKKGSCCQSRPWLSFLCLLNHMFHISVSYLGHLTEVVKRCSLPYMSTIHEILHDGTHVYGVELEVGDQVLQGVPKTLFFWADPAVGAAAGYEEASLQAIAFLQRVYGFIVLDYSIHGLHLYRSLAHRLFPIANRGTQLARLVVAGYQQRDMPSSALLVAAESLLHEVVLPSVGSEP